MRNTRPVDEASPPPKRWPPVRPSRSSRACSLDNGLGRYRLSRSRRCRAGQPAARIPKENGEVRCLIGVDVPDPIETALAFVYGSVLARDEVAENVPT